MKVSSNQIDNSSTKYSAYSFYSRSESLYIYRLPGSGEGHEIHAKDSNGKWHYWKEFFPPTSRYYQRVCDIKLNELKRLIQLKA